MNTELKQKLAIIGGELEELYAACTDNTDQARIDLLIDMLESILNK